MTQINEHTTKTATITAGFIAMMHAAEIGYWSETEAYGEWPHRPGIVFGQLPSEPVNALGVHPYPVSTDTQPDVDTLGIQVRIRTDSPYPDDALRIADQLEEFFHGREHLTFGDWHVPVMWRHSVAVLGPNTNDHFEITDNYYMHVDIPNRKVAYHG